MKGKAFLHFINYLFGFEEAHTQTTNAEIGLIKKYANQKKYVVEIGVYEAQQSPGTLPPSNKRHLHRREPARRGVAKNG